MTVPGHGESVGDAYIRIHADGGGIPEDIKREFDSGRSAYDEAGRKDAEAHRRSFEQRDQQLFGRYLQDQIKQEQRASQARERVQTNSLANQLRAIRQQQAAANQLRTNSLRQEIQNNIKAQRAEQERIRLIQRDENRAYREEETRQRARRLDADRLNEQLIRLARQRRDILIGLDRSYALSSNKTLREQIAGAAGRHDVVELRRLLQATQRDVDGLGNGTRRLDGRMKPLLRDTTDFERSMHRARGRVDEMSNALARASGKGSRNNFFNFLGSLTGAAARAGGRATVGLLNDIAHGYGNIQNAIKTGEGRRGILSNLGSLGLRSVETGFKALAKAVLGGFAALNLFYLIAGPLAALLSMLAGSVAALASTIVIGLVGALGAALPLLAALGVGFAVIGVAFAGLSRQSKAAQAERKKLMGPLIADFHHLQDVTRESLFSQLPQQVKALRPIFHNVLEPLFRDSAKAMSGAFTGFLGGLNSPEQKRNFAVIDKFIPQAIAKLGKIGTNVFVGIGGLLRGLIPTANKLLTVMLKGSENFRRFTNSASGQNRIKTFMEGAWVSAVKLGNTIKLTYRVLRDLFGLGKATGDSMFDSINSSLQRFDTYLRSSRGREEVRGYFEDVRRFVGAVGNFVGGIGHLFGALDNSQSRGTLNGLLTVLGGFMGILGDAMPIISGFQRAVGHLLAQLGPPLTRIFDALGPMIATFADVVSTVLAGAVRLLVDILRPALDQLANFLEFINRHGDVFGPIIQGLAGLWLAFKGYQIISGATGAIRTFFSNVVTAIQGGITRVRAMSLRARAAVSAAGALAAGGVIGNIAGNKIKGPGGLLAGLGGGAVAGGLIGATVGGPTGAAVGALAGAIAGLTSAWITEENQASKSGQAVKRALDVQKDAAATLLSMLQSVNGAYNEQYKQALVQKLDQRGLLAGADKAGVDVTLVPKAALGDAQAYLAVVDGINKKYGENSPIARKYIDDLNRIRGGTKDAESAFERQKRALGELIAANGKLDLSVKGLSGVFTTGSTELRGMGAAGLRNRAVITELIGVIDKATVAQEKHGASADTVARTYAHQIGTLRSSLKQMHFNGAAIDDIIHKYGKLPKSVITKILADPKPAHLATITALRNLGLLPDSVLTKILGDGTDNHKKVAEALYKLGLIPKSVLSRILGKDETAGPAASARGHIASVHGTTAVIAANTAPAIAAVNDFIFRARNAAAVVTVDADISPAVRKIGSLTGLLPGQTFFGFASGGVLTGPRRILAGEAGPEAIVPLRRPLGQVDPSVRLLSAFAQGKLGTPAYASGGTVGGGGRTINIEKGAIQVVTPATDPYAVAEQTVNRIVTRSYGG